MDPWLSSFRKSEAGELSVFVRDKGPVRAVVATSIGAASVGAALLFKVLEGTSPSYPTASAFICSVPVLCVTLITAY